MFKGNFSINAYQYLYLLSMIPLSNQITLRQLEYFMAVAEHLHFRKAAEALYITQPGLSRQIKQMEDDLKVKLFLRSNRKVSLTLAGKYLLRESKSILKNLNAAIEHSRLLQKGLAGNLRFGYVGSAMQNAIPTLLLEIRKVYPNVIFDLKEMDNNSQVEALINDDIDLGFIRMERVPKGIRVKPFFEDTFSLVLPKGHTINKKNFKGLAQLKDERFILFEKSYSDSYYESIMQLFDEAWFTPTISHSTVHASSIYRLVENNFGISIVPSALQLGYDMDVKFIELKNSKHRAKLNIAWKEGNRNPSLKNVFESGLV